MRSTKAFLAALIFWTGCLVSAALAQNPGFVGPGQVGANYGAGYRGNNWLFQSPSCPSSTIVSAYQLMALTSGAPSSVPIAIWDGTQCVTVGSLNASAHSFSAIPGGSNTQLEYNNSGIFGGVSGFTTDGTNLTGGAGALLKLAASASGGATFNIQQGAAPTSPNNGDIWATSTGLFVRIAGSTVGPLSAGGSGGSPGGSNTQLQFNNSGVFAGTSTLTYSSSTLFDTANAFGSLQIQDASASQDKMLLGVASAGACSFLGTSACSQISFTPNSVGSFKNVLDIRANQNSGLVLENFGSVEAPKLLLSGEDTVQIPDLEGQHAGGAFAAYARAGSGQIAFNFINLGVTTGSGTLGTSDGSTVVQIEGLSNGGSSQNMVAFYQARGTVWNGTLTALQAGDRMGEVAGFASYGASFLATECPSMNFYADQTVTSSANGSNIIFRNCLTGTASEVVVGGFFANGGFVVGAAATSANGYTGSSGSITFVDGGSATSTPSGTSALTSTSGRPQWWSATAGNGANIAYETGTFTAAHAICVGGSVGSIVDCGSSGGTLTSVTLHPGTPSAFTSDCVITSSGTCNLPEYVQGTWTPTLTTTGTVGTPAYNTQSGSYEQIGRQITARFFIVISGWTGSPTGNIEVGLPVTSANVANDYGICYYTAYTVNGLATNNFGIGGYVAPNTGVATVVSNATANTPGVTAAQFGSANNNAIMGFCTYHV